MSPKTVVVTVTRSGKTIMFTVHGGTTMDSVSEHPVLDWRDGTGERELHDGGPERGDDEPQRHRGDAGRCREKVCRACGPWILVDKILQGALFISGAGRMRGNPARGLFRCVYGGWQSRMPWSRGRLRDRKIPGHTSRYSGKIAYWMYQRCCTTGIQKW